MTSRLGCPQTDHPRPSGEPRDVTSVEAPEDDALKVSEPRATDATAGGRSARDPCRRAHPTVARAVRRGRGNGARGGRGRTGRAPCAIRGPRGISKTLEHPYRVHARRARTGPGGGDRG